MASATLYNEEDSTITLQLRKVFRSENRSKPQGMEVSEQREKMKREKRNIENPRRRGVFVTN